MQTPKNKYHNVNNDDPFEGTTAKLKGGEPLDTQVDLDAMDTEYFTKTIDSNGDVRLYICIFSKKREDSDRPIGQANTLDIF